MTDAWHTIGESPSVPVRLRRSARARKMSLRVSHVRGDVTLTLPPHVAAQEGLRFARSKLDWIRRHLAKATPPQSLRPGMVMPLRGQECTLIAAPGRKTPRFEEGNLYVPTRHTGKALEAWLRAEARRDVAESAEHYASRLGKSFDRLVISDTRTRWGSCSSRGRLMLSFRLVMAPPEVLSYVVAHEIAHLAEMNHSARFWAVCARLYGDYEPPRQWLKTHGPALHGFRFLHDEANVD